MKILEQGTIKDSYDIMKLNIIDWNRLNGSWSNAGEALKTITSWFKGRAQYSIVEYDLTIAPNRNDWPEWNHIGNHERMGRLYWNTFKGREIEGETLVFSDAPDFYGKMVAFEGCSRKFVDFWGDIGRVSAQAFAITQKSMRAHDIWISLPDEKHQIIIEVQSDIKALYAYHMTEDEEALVIAEELAVNCSCNNHISARALVQLPLF